MRWSAVADLPNSVRQHLQDIVDQQQGMKTPRIKRINALCLGFADMAVTEGISRYGLDIEPRLHGQLFAEGFFLALSMTRHTPEAAAELAKFIDEQGAMDPTVAEMAARLLYPDQEEQE